MLTFEEIKKNPQIAEFIKRSGNISRMSVILIMVFAMLTLWLIGQPRLPVI